jgi:hypothetical protein
MGRDISCLKDKRIDEMRRKPVAVIVLVSSVSVFNLATPARAASDPVCLTGGSDNALRCDFANFEECRATASGGLGYFVRIRRPSSVRMRAIADLQSSSSIGVDAPASECPTQVILPRAASSLRSPGGEALQTGAIGAILQ